MEQGQQVERGQQDRFERRGVYRYGRFECFMGHGMVMVEVGCSGEEHMVVVHQSRVRVYG